jgi:diguanylate cyclase (GGDEF)-like protein
MISSVAVRWHFIKKYRNPHFTDELTGLKNSNGLKSFLENFISNDSTKTHPVSLVLIDIDDFNKLNLELGYINADKILAKVGEYLKGDSRSTDTTFRYHQKGDEFLVVLTKTTQSEAKTAAERKRKDIEELLIQLESKTYSVKVSCGITELKKIDSIESLLLRTENALMEAKRQLGKNCTKTII